MVYVVIMQYDKKNVIMLTYLNRSIIHIHSIYTCVSSFCNCRSKFRGG